MRELGVEIEGPPWIFAFSLTSAPSHANLRMTADRIAGHSLQHLR